MQTRNNQFPLFFPGGWHEVGSEGRDDWWAHDNSKKLMQVYISTFFAQALCMNELKGCQKFSMGPNFIYFGAQKWENPVFHWTLSTIPRRYGYRPIPSEIDTAELLKLRETLVGMKNDVHLMDKWSVRIVFRIKTFFPDETSLAQGIGKTRTRHRLSLSCSP